MSSQPHPNLKVIHGGKSLVANPDTVAVDELRNMPAKRRLDAIISHPDAKSVTRSLPAPDVYWLIKEIGLMDCGELIELASPEQMLFCLDMDIWHRWIPLTESLFEWLGLLMESDQKTILEKVRALDQELLILFLKQEILVGGGLQLLSDDDPAEGDWDHSFDNIYYVKFLNKEHAFIVGQMLDYLCQFDQSLYVSLLEGVRGELTVDLQEVSFQFRTARLTDFGFPELSMALELYSFVDPDRFVPAAGKAEFSSEGYEFLPLTVSGDDLFSQALSLAPASVHAELKLLFNNAIVAEGMPFSDADAIRRLYRRVSGYLSLALQFLGGMDVSVAANLLQNNYLKDLFRLGFSLTLRLQHRAQSLSRGDMKVNHPTERALEGIKKKHPLYYRGFDDDLADGYREFRTLYDLQVVESFIESLQGRSS